MKFSYFQSVFTQLSHWPLDSDGRYFLCARPLRLWDGETGRTVKFTSMREAWDYVFDGVKTVEAALSGIERFELPALSGRKGGSSSMKDFKFGHAPHGRDYGNAIMHQNAELNTRITVKTEKDAIKYFSDLFTNADHEYGMAIDNQGYVHRYIEGGDTSVPIWGRKGELVIHNHPSGGAFSDSDLISTSRSSESGIVAIGKGGDYYFRKNGGHFKSAQFERAVRRAKLRGHDYDDAVRRWLRANQKQYGYRFEFKKR
jgi:hypothetical protein